MDATIELSFEYFAQITQFAQPEHF